MVLVDRMKVHFWRQLLRREHEIEAAISVFGATATELEVQQEGAWFWAVLKNTQLWTCLANSSSGLVGPTCVLGLPERIWVESPQWPGWQIDAGLLFHKKRAWGVWENYALAVESRIRYLPSPPHFPSTGQADCWAWIGRWSKARILSTYVWLPLLPFVTTLITLA